ncbi:6-phosphogluconolactonase [Nitrosomonas sp. Nm51]|uniref:6-phosphogluconolactonase n=1 Tax=Nitrosomonas sp. Nm51 TaxID=133720 RepID=UPI0008C9B936|nr:6-phosphogluconolactonase [Nitrosomonas sp. Nm51]SER64329.1 6-phosphogluconolactonase [Nitrosomonas sp. Nm51]
MQKLQRNVYTTIDALAQGFAGYAADILSAALIRQETVSLVVPGGSTPRAYLPVLAAQPLPWHRIAITLSDERWVDTGSKDSNERLIRTCLLRHLNAQPHFTGLKTPHGTPEAAVPEIQQRLSAMPQPFTLTVLGLGEDGHTASLFPGLKLHEAAHSTTEQRCIAVYPPVAPSPRVSLSLDTLAGSAHIAVAVTGKTKRQLLDRLEKNADPAIPLVWLLQRVQTPIAVFEMD